MMLPIIRVRDKDSDKVHIVGTDTHDRLFINRDGSLHYYNLQNGDGCGVGTNYGYEFVTGDSQSEDAPFVELMGLDDIIELFCEQAAMSVEQERKFREEFVPMMRKLQEEREKTEDAGIRFMI